MLRLLGILTLGNLLFGGRHHRRALGRGLLFGALLGYLANRDFDADRVAEDIREKARKAKRTARDAVKAAKREIRKSTGELPRFMRKPMPGERSARNA